MIANLTGARRLACRALAVAALCFLTFAELRAQPEPLEAPFGDKVSERVPFYHRAAPTIATAGPLGRLGIIEAKSVGFKSILNLGRSTTAAGLDDASMASYVLLGYFSVPSAETLPTPDQIAEIRRILDAAENRPILIYGIDRDQAAAAWALIRAASGIPAELALQDGLTAGLRDRLGAVRERLGLGKQTSISRSVGMRCQDQLPVPLHKHVLCGSRQLPSPYASRSGRSSRSSVFRSLKICT
jgi:hypothetical protein